MRPPFYDWHEPDADRDALAQKKFVIVDGFGDNAGVWTIASYARAFVLSQDEAAVELADGLVPRGNTWVFLD